MFHFLFVCFHQQCSLTTEQFQFSTICPHYKEETTKGMSTCPCYDHQSDDCIQELTYHQAMPQIFLYNYIHDSLHHRNSLPFHEHYQLSKTTTRSHPLSIWPIPLTINMYQFSFLLTAHSFGILYHTPSYELSLFRFASFSDIVCNSIVCLVVWIFVMPSPLNVTAVYLCMGTGEYIYS